MNYTKKSVGSVSVIGGADGPTSVWLAGKNGNRKQTLSQRFRKWQYARRRKHVIGNLTAHPHSMDEVAAYIKRTWEFDEVARDSNEYQREYTEMRAELLLQHESELLLQQEPELLLQQERKLLLQHELELLGNMSELPKLETYDETALKRYMEQIKLRKNAAKQVPVDLFDIDMCILKKTDGKTIIKVVLEKKYGYIGGSASGKKNMKKFEKMMQKIYNCYGVTQHDIDRKTERYQNLVRMLAMR